MSLSQPDDNRFTNYTPTNHQAPLWIATAISLTYCAFFLLVRLFVKYRLWALDDVAIGLAHSLGLAQWVVTFSALRHGVGEIARSGNNTLQPLAAKLVFASWILTLLTAGLSKCSVVMFLRHMFSGTYNKAWTLCNYLLVGMACWTVISALVVSVGCSPIGALNGEGQAYCTGDLPRWRTVTGLDVVLEVLLALIPIYLFDVVQISRRRKWTIVASFLPRLGVAALFIIFLRAYVQYRQHGRPTIDIVDTMVLQQALCGYSLMSATTPCLKGFLAGLRTGDLSRLSDENTTYGRSYGQASGRRTHQQSYALETLKSKHQEESPQVDEPAGMGHRPAEVLSTASAYAEPSGDNGDGSVNSFGSEQMIIHRKVEFGVTSS